MEEVKEPCADFLRDTAKDFGEWAGVDSAPLPSSVEPIPEGLQDAVAPGTRNAAVIAAASATARGG